MNPNKQNNKNRIKEVLIFVLTVVVFMSLLSFIPSGIYKKIGLKPIDIFSDIRETGKNSYNDQTGLTIGLKPFDYKKHLGQSPEHYHNKKDSILNDLCLIEDYSTGKNGLKYFIDALNKKDTLRKLIRVGFVGDSFIEGDIVVADIREQLQDLYGGCGVGYVGLSSEHAGFRQSVKHTFSGWEEMKMNESKNFDYSNLNLSGRYFTPYTNAWSTYKGSSFRKHLDKFNIAKILVKTENPIRLSINNENNKQTYNLSGQPEVQKIVFPCKNSGTIHLSVDSIKNSKFIGIWLEDTCGISVDNYSLRGNSGSGFALMPEKLSKEIDSLLNYDLIILQFGLNVATNGVTDYSSYKQSMTKVVKKLKQNYPNSSIMIWGVSDRGAKEGGKIETMTGIRELIAVQRSVAMETGITFWSVFNAMGGNGSMVKFAGHNPPYAAKDYTHLSFAGGAYIASRFVKSLQYEINKNKH